MNGFCDALRLHGFGPCETKVNNLYIYNIYYSLIYKKYTIIFIKSKYFFNYFGLFLYKVPDFFPERAKKFTQTLKYLKIKNAYFSIKKSTYTFL